MYMPGGVFLWPNPFFGQPADPPRPHVEGGVRGGRQRRGRSLMHLAKLLCLIALVFVVYYIEGELGPLFSSSLERDSRLHVPRVTTQQPGVVEGIEYFVAPEFRYTYASNPEHLAKVEVWVTEQYARKLRKECQIAYQRHVKERTQAMKREMASRTQGVLDPYREVENTRLLPCKEAARKLGPVTVTLDTVTSVLMVYNDGHLDTSIYLGSRVIHRGRA